MWFCRYDEQFVVASFDSAPTADSEIYGKLDQSVRDAHETHVREIYSEAKSQCCRHI